MRIARVIHCVDAHAEGEPSRIVVGGVLDVPGDDDAREDARAGARGRLAAAAAACSSRAGRRRCPPTSCCRPRTRRPTPASSSWSPRPTRACRGRTRSTPRRCCSRPAWSRWSSRSPSLVLEAPAGLVRVRARVRGRRRRADHVRERAVVLHRAGRGRSRCRASGTLTVDVAYGGAFVRVRRRRARWASRSCPTRRATLAELGERIRPHVAEQLAIAHPLEAGALATSRSSSSSPRRGSAATPATPRSSPPAGSTARPPAPRPPPASPCSTRAATMGDDLRRRERDRHDVHRPGRRAARRSATLDAVVPAITGRAWITGFHQLVVDPTDPLRDGFKLPGHLGRRAARGHAQPLERV